MSSLQNTYSPDDIAKRDEWLRRIQQKQDIPEWTYIVEPKLDGMSVELVYEYGMFTRAVTRWDGESGEDITEHAKQLSGLPKEILALKTISVIAFRGEIVLTKDAFARLTWVMTTSWGTFANARNAAAGTLRQLDTSLVQKRWLTVFVYDILFVDGDIGCASAEDQFALFRTWWLPILDRLSSYTTIQEVMERCSSSETQQIAEQQRVDLDWLVIKIQEFSIRQLFWSTNHHPKWAIAYKFPAQQAITKLEEVSFQVGRTGILTPVAHLTPTQLSGVTISRASLHNRAFIQERWLYIGDRVILQRSGEVIPYIVAGLPERRDGTEKQIEQPKMCPVCAHPVYLDDRALALWCGNTTCDAQIKQRLEHAVSKSCLDIGGLWPSLIESCVNAWLIYTLADLFVLTTSEKKQIMRWLPGVGDKKIARLEEEIAQKKPYALRRVINALGIRHIGEVSARDIASAYMLSSEMHEKNVQEFICYCLQATTIEKIHGFWKEMIASLQHFFQDEDNTSVLTRLDAYDVIDRWSQENNVSSWLLTNIHVVITWSFSATRDEIANFLRTHGATIQPTVNQKTDILLAWVGWWSKRSLAESSWVPILTLEEIYQKFWLPQIAPESRSMPTPSLQQASLF
jgi:DNA ligase (NAD+)